MGTKEQIEALTNEARAKCTHLIVSAAVRYWEDATVNGEADTEGKLIPLRVGDAWEPTIELVTGKIIGWPDGVEASLCYKVCDEGLYWLGEANRTQIYKWGGHYVPDDLLAIGDRGYGDYINMQIDGTGQIKDWTPPKIDWEEWELVA